MKFSGIALLSAATLAVAQPHQHDHMHRRHGSPSPVEVRAAAVVEAPGPVVTIYELNGEDIPWDEVEAGIKSGKYVLVGDKISNVVQPTPAPTPSSTTTPTPTPTPSSSSVEVAKFFEQTSSTSAYVEPSPSPEPAPSPEPSYSGGGDVNSDFPSGQIKCSEFPSEYGAIALDYLGHNGWTGVQKVPDFSSLSIDSVISYIETAISGDGCTEKSFCTYACPAGYQKSQWPEAQGNTGQSIGGLYCNADGYLELSRPSESKICTPGVGGVKVKSNLSKNAAICRTEYPGTESEVIPLNTQPGQEYDLTCPDAKTYYQWQGSATSAQYYINNAGVSQEDACQWSYAGSNMGNWAPVNMGVGRGLDGNTYISLFPNAPTNPDGKLNFNIDVKGDVSGSCSYSDGQYYQGSSASPTGCTVGVPKGGSAYFEFS